VFSGRTRAERRSREVGAGVEFADYRRYAAGDDYRRVDWNVYGRTDRLVLRLHQQEEDLSVYLLVDCSASMAFGEPSKLVYAKKLAAAIAYIALHHLDRVSVTAFQNGRLLRLAPTRGRNRIFRVFEFLRPLAAYGQTQLVDAAAAFVAQNRRRGVVVVISDLYDPDGFERAIDTLRYAKFEVYVLHVTDPTEAYAPALGDVELIDAESGEARNVTVSPKLASQYAEAYRGYRERVRRFCVQKQVPLFEVPTDTAPEETVLGILRRGGMFTA
jgi:uncharacterized protein (DUF58 family)